MSFSYGQTIPFLLMCKHGAPRGGYAPDALVLLLVYKQHYITTIQTCQQLYIILFANYIKFTYSSYSLRTRINCARTLDFSRFIGYNYAVLYIVCSGIEVVITALTRNFWKLWPFRPLKMSAAQGFARVRISQLHIVLACFSCILPEQGLHLRYTESCPRGRRCDTRNHVISSKK